MAETAAFRDAKALVMGVLSTQLSAEAESALLAQLTLVERGSLLPLYWGRLDAIDHEITTRNMLVYALWSRPGQPAPLFDTAAVVAGLTALLRLFTKRRLQARLDATQGTLDDAHERIADCLWRVLTRMTAPLPTAARDLLRLLLPAMQRAKPLHQLAAARLAGDTATITTATATLMAQARGDLQAQEWHALLQAEPMDFVQIAEALLPASGLHSIDAQDIHRLFDRVPGYATFAATLMANAATRLQAIAQGDAPYKADGAFVLDDCHVLNRAIGYGLYLGADWCLGGIETLWLQAAMAPDPAAKSMPSQSLTIGLGHATVAEPWPQAYLALCKVAKACRHAGVAKKLARFQKSALTALAARPERMLDFDPAAALPKSLRIPYRDAVQGLMARIRPMSMADWQRHFAPSRADGWALAQGLIWEILGHDGALSITAMPTKSKAGLIWQDVNGQTVTPRADALVRLWHPVETPPALAQAWRARLQVLGITQPFLQAGRQIFIPKATELATIRTCHFAGRVVDGAALFGLSRVAGWRAGFDDALHLQLEGTRFIFHAGIRAAPIGGIGTTGDLMLDRLPIGAQPTFADLPPRLLSEAMRRVDLLVTVGTRAM